MTYIEHSVGHLSQQELFNRWRTLIIISKWRTFYDKVIENNSN